MKPVETFPYKQRDKQISSGYISVKVLGNKTVGQMRVDRGGQSGD